MVTGDFVTSRGRRRHRENAIHAAKAIEPCAQLLAKMHAPSGILASLGNHDVDGDPSHIIDVLQSHNISVLRNRSVPLERESKRLWLCGVDDILSGKPRLDLALKEIPAGEPAVLLAHEPDWADFVARYPVDLQLSGHSHGGQIQTSADRRSLPAPSGPKISLGAATNRRAHALHQRRHWHH